MQRLAGDFMVKQSVMYHLENGNIVELYELPNGQWQFGKGRDAVVVTSLEEVEHLDAKTKSQIAAWLERTKHQPAPVAVQQGMTPQLSGDTARDQLSRAISKMSDEVVNRLLGAITQTLGPVADSILQGDGPDEIHHAPASVTTQNFELPAGARWCDATRPASGYLTFPDGVLDAHGKQVSVWHPTPEFHRVTQEPEPIPVAETAFEQELKQEREKHPEVVGAGRASGRRRK